MLDHRGAHPRRIRDITRVVSEGEGGVRRPHKNQRPPQHREEESVSYQPPVARNRSAIFGATVETAYRSSKKRAGVSLVLRFDFVGTLRNERESPANKQSCHDELIIVDSGVGNLVSHPGCARWPGRPGLCAPGGLVRLYLITHFSWDGYRH